MSDRDNYKIDGSLSDKENLTGSLAEEEVITGTLSDNLDVTGSLSTDMELSGTVSKALGNIYGELSLGPGHPIISDDYNFLTNKPQIEGHELKGNSLLEQIGVVDITNAELAQLLV